MDGFTHAFVAYKDCTCSRRQSRAESSITASAQPSLCVRYSQGRGDVGVASARYFQMGCEGSIDGVVDRACEERAIACGPDGEAQDLSQLGSAFWGGIRSDRLE